MIKGPGRDLVLLTPEQAAEHTDGITPRRLRELVRTELIRAYQVAGLLLFHLADLYADRLCLGEGPGHGHVILPLSVERLLGTAKLAAIPGSGQAAPGPPLPATPRRCLLSSRQAATDLGVSAADLRRLAAVVEEGRPAHSGLVRAYRIKRRFIWDAEDVDALDLSDHPRLLAARHRQAARVARE